MDIWEPKPPGTLWATPGLLRDCFTFYALYILSVQYIFLKKIQVLDKRRT